MEEGLSLTIVARPIPFVLSLSKYGDTILRQAQEERGVRGEEQKGRVGHSRKNRTPINLSTGKSGCPLFTPPHPLTRMGFPTS